MLWSESSRFVKMRPRLAPNRAIPTDGQLVLGSPEQVLDARAGNKARTQKEDLSAYIELLISFPDAIGSSRDAYFSAIVDV
jgi:hypothetical protein